MTLLHYESQFSRFLAEELGLFALASASANSDDIWMAEAEAEAHRKAVLSMTPGRWPSPIHSFTMGEFQ